MGVGALISAPITPQPKIREPEVSEKNNSSLVFSALIYNIFWTQTKYNLQIVIISERDSVSTNMAYQ